MANGDTIPYAEPARRHPTPTSGGESLMAMYLRLPVNFAWDRRLGVCSASALGLFIFALRRALEFTDHNFIAHEDLRRFADNDRQFRASLHELVANGVLIPTSFSEEWGGERLMDSGYSIHEDYWSRQQLRTRKPIPPEVRAAVILAADGKCLLCGATDDLTLDHIQPWSLGGSDDADNLRCLCRSCNSRKGARV